MKLSEYLKDFDVYEYHEKYTQDWSKLSFEQCLFALEQEENVMVDFIHDGKTLVCRRFDIILSIVFDNVDKSTTLNIRNLFRQSANKNQEKFQAKFREIYVKG